MNVDPGDVLALAILGGLVLWFVRGVFMGSPPVRWTRSWARLLWRLLTYRKPN